MFTLEIDRRAVAVIDASEEEAHAFFDDEDFRADLRAMTSGGAPLWDGKGPLTVRPASQDEVDAFEDVVGGDDEDFDPDEEDEDDEAGINVAFLVPIDQDDEAADDE